MQQATYLKDGQPTGSRGHREGPESSVRGGDEDPGRSLGCVSRGQLEVAVSFPAAHAERWAVAMGWSLVLDAPELEKRVRSLLVIVMLAVLGRNHEL